MLMSKDTDSPMASGRNYDYAHASFFVLRDVNDKKTEQNDMFYGMNSEFIVTVRKSNLFNHHTIEFLKRLELNCQKYQKIEI